MASPTASASTSIVSVANVVYTGVGAESCPAQQTLTMTAVSGVIIPTPAAINGHM